MKGLSTSGLSKYIVPFLLVVCIGLAKAQKDEGLQKPQNILSVRYVDSAYLVKDKTSNLYDRVFVGNVFLEEKEKVIKFFCDSAYEHADTQIIEAFGKVQVTKGDTLELLGDYMSFDLVENLLKVRKNAVLENQQAKLITDSLDYDLEEEIGYYEYGGELQDSTTTLVSRIGKYYTATGDVNFIDNVVITGEDYTIKTDSLRYNVNTNIVTIIAPTNVDSEEYKMYTERGVYNTATGISNFTKETRLENKSYVLTGDTLDYDQKSGIGIVTHNAKLIDTLNNMLLFSNNMLSNQKDSTVLATKDIELQFITEQDTLFAHSDTIFVSKDSLQNNVLEVYRKMKFFKKDVQGKADSMSFSSSDSTMRMFHNPTVWSGANQLTADTIRAIFVEKKMKYIDLRQNAFVSSSSDSTKNYYNQMKGRNMRGFIVDDSLKVIEVYGNSESMYFAEEKGAIIGLNRLRSSDITIRLSNQRMKTLVSRTQPIGTLHPVIYFDKIPLYLGGFRWDVANRPLRREDIFEWTEAQPMDFATPKRDVITEDVEEPEEKVGEIEEENSEDMMKKSKEERKKERKNRREERRKKRKEK